MQNTDKNRKQTITFFLTIKQVGQDCFFSIYAKENPEASPSTFPSIGAEVCLPLPTTLFQALTKWQTAYHSFYREASSKSSTSQQNNNPQQSPQSGLSIRRKEGKKTPQVDKKVFLQRAESALIDLFQTWLDSQVAFPIRDFIQKKLGLNYHFPDISTQNVQFKTIDLLIDCQGENAPQLRQLPWSSWQIKPLTEQQKTDVSINIIQTTNPTRKYIPKPSRSQLRILVLVGEDPYLDFYELKVIAQKLDQKASVSLEFIEARTYPSRRDYLAQVRLALLDNRSWDALLIISHGSEDNEGGYLQFSPEIKFSISEIAQELTFAQENGLRFALLNCCQGHSLAEFLIRNGLHQVYAFSEKINHESLKKITSIFIENLRKNQSLKQIHRQILATLNQEKVEYPSLNLIPRLFQYPDINITDFQIAVNPLKYIWQTIKPKSKVEIWTMTAILLLSMTWPVQDLLTDVRLFIQAIARTPFIGMNAQKVIPPKIQLISIDQKTINRQRQENYSDIEEKPIDRRLIADILGNLNQLNPQVIGINYLLANKTEYGETLQESIDELQTNTPPLERPWLVFLSDSFRDEMSNHLFFNPQKSLSGDGNFLIWELDKPSEFKCRSECSFSFRLAQAYQLRQSLNETIITGINSSFDDDNAPLFQDNINSFYLEKALTASTSVNKTVSTFNIQLSDGENQSFWQSLWSLLGQMIVPYSLVDYSQPPDFIYEKISAQDFLDRSTEEDLTQAFKAQFQNRIIIITAGDYSEVSGNNASLPIATHYWCSRYISQRVTKSVPQCSRDLTAGEIHAYRTFHYLTQDNFRQVSFFWTVILGIISAKLLQYLSKTIKIQNNQKFRTNIAFLLLSLNILNIFVFMVIKISIPLSLASGIIVYYMNRNLRSTNYYEI